MSGRAGETKRRGRARVARCTRRVRGRFKARRACAATLAKPESWKSIAATWLLKVLDDDGTLEDILDGADAQYREDVLVLAAVGVAVLTAFLMLVLWLGRRVLFDNVDRPFFDQRENDDILGVAPTPQIGGDGRRSLTTTSRGKLCLMPFHGQSGGRWCEDRRPFRRARRAAPLLILRWRPPRRRLH